MKYKLITYLFCALFSVYNIFGKTLGDLNSTKSTAMLDLKLHKIAVVDIKLPETTLKTLNESDTNLCVNDTSEMCKQTTESYENTTLIESNSFMENSGGIKVQTVLPNEKNPINASNTVNETASDSLNQTHGMSLFNTSIVENINLGFSQVPEEKCYCDLIKDLCDINCCCDRNCTPEDRAVFSRCIKTEEHLTSHQCVSKYMIYLNNTQYQVIEDQIGLFCIVVDNMYVKFEYSKHPALISVKDFLKLWKRHAYYSWDWNLPDAKTYKTNEVYKAGAPVLVVRNTSLVPLAFPIQVISSLCQGEVEVQFLKDFDSSCLRPIPKSEEECQQFNYVFHDRILSSTSLLNLTQLENCTEDVCVQVNKFVCFGSRDDKKCVEKNLTLSAFNSSSKSCNNLIESVHYIIYHNGTQGIIQVKVFIHVFNASISNRNAFRQYFRVNFEWMRFDNETGFPRSGYPGYVVGRPVISAVYNSNVNDEKENKTLELSNFAEDWLSLTTVNDDGSCNKNKRVNVIFGHNSWTKCNFKVVGDFQHVQTTVWQQLVGRKMNRTDKIYVSSFGDPNVNDLDQWVPLLQDNLFETSQLLTQIKIKIIFTNVGSILNPQAKIIGVHLEPHYTNSEITNQSQVISLISSVIFEDITKPPLAVFAKPPVFEIKLPKDFFYPFLSECAFNTPNIYLVLMQLVIVYYHRL